MVNVFKFFIDTFNNSSGGFNANKSNFISAIVIALALIYFDIKANTVLILVAVYFFYQKYIEEQNKEIKHHKKHKKYKDILTHKDSGQLIKIFNKIYKFKKYNKKSYNQGKKCYNRFLKYIKDGDRGNENLKHVYDLAVNELNESLNQFISMTLSLPAVAGYKKGTQISNLELDEQLSAACEELYMYSIDLLEHLLNEIHTEWETNKHRGASYVDRADIRLPKPSDFKDILYDNKFSIYNL
jgi:ABC-type nickel/cobalt efflux system permease component RcnA